VAKHDELDRLLDESLSSYAEPVHGLEERVLRGVSASASPRPRLLWLWPAGLAAAAVLLLFVATPWRSPLPPHAAPSPQIARTPAPQRDVVRNVDKAVPLPRHGAAHLQRAVAQTTVAEQEPLPKLDVFPSPSPLSAEERALAGLVARSSAQEQHALLAARQQADAPIRISAITVPPISSPDKGKE